MTEVPEHYRSRSIQHCKLRSPEKKNNPNATSGVLMRSGHAALRFRQHPLHCLLSVCVSLSTERSNLTSVNQIISERIASVHIALGSLADQTPASKPLRQQPCLEAPRGPLGSRPRLQDFLVLLRIVGL